MEVQGALRPAEDVSETYLSLWRNRFCFTDYLSRVPLDARRMRPALPALSLLPGPCMTPSSSRTSPRSSLLDFWLLLHDSDLLTA